MMLVEFPGVDVDVPEIDEILDAWVATVALTFEPEYRV